MALGDTKISILNLALSYLQVEPINDWETPGPKYGALAAMYDVIKPALLQKSAWSFALKSARLSRLTDPSDYPNYTYMYEIPVDCLSIWQLLTGPYQNVGDYQKLGTRIYSNATSLYIMYVFNQTENNFPPSFTNCLALRLAANGGMLFTQQAAIVKALDEQATQAFLEAATNDAQQHTPYLIQNFPSVTVRYDG